MRSIPKWVVVKWHVFRGINQEFRIVARDKYVLKISCPQCDNEGHAHVSENDGGAFIRERGFQIDNLPKGFSALRVETGRSGTSTMKCDCGCEFEW